jgi:hypothetical protein
MNQKPVLRIRYPLRFEENFLISLPFTNNSTTGPHPETMFTTHFYKIHIVFPSTQMTVSVFNLRPKFIYVSY